ncbi:hypothetical protein PN36_30190 [Candidatus Thiomargarita nelsonii]|uniref:Uncharacterized protein n=1 Tax=Candidatus Thiomargarita nelsonii TaxID=1003181 RepID=A0A0A6P3I8_9GAMM|nr:hypothetical protein PN36_30190 [Candidatus Thiomargarita nelsonii]
MNSDATPRLMLQDLAAGLPAITPAFGACLAEAGAICLENSGQKCGVELSVTGDLTGCFKLYWPEVTEQMRRCWNDYEVTTEHGAYAIAFLLIRELTNFTIIERSFKGTGIDYWLGDKNALFFRKKARLEVSGIREGNQSRIKSRLNIKLKQTTRSHGILPAYIVIVEFSQPTAQVVLK